MESLEYIFVENMEHPQIKGRKKISQNLWGKMLSNRDIKKNQLEINFEMI